MLAILSSLDASLTIAERRVLAAARDGKSITESISKDLGDGHFEFQGKRGVWRTLSNGDKAFFTDDGERLVGGGPPQAQGAQGSQTGRVGGSPVSGKALEAAKQDVMAAYGDSHGKGRAPRKLNFLGQPMTPKDWTDTMKAATEGGYNAFEAGRVGKILQKFDGITVTPARESSVGAYVSGPPETLKKVSAALARTKVRTPGTFGGSISPDENWIDDRAEVLDFEGPEMGEPKRTGEKDKHGFSAYAKKKNPARGSLRLWWD